MRKYDHKRIEARWQKEWEEAGIFQAPDNSRGKKNYYLLVEFPYPSGNLHVGHWYAFAVPDVFARYRRMKGDNILFPIGFDAFGLPAENAAIKRGLNPRRWTYDNIDHMRRQIKTMGASFDWSREVITADPSYYRWTQWLFLKLFRAGLVRQAESEVNWCPSCKTVLANEQAVGGKCERCDSAVLKKSMRQWMIAITKYADRLIDDLKELSWPESIKESQRHWIGRTEGVEIDFTVKNTKLESKIRIFTTRPDTIFGAMYLVLSPEHEEIAKLKPQVENRSEIDEYIEQAKKKTDIERTAEEKKKTGVELRGIKAINPASGDEIPVWVADYVLPHYGTGAIMAVPAHDQRDFEFAKKYGLPVRMVVCPHYPAPTCPILDQAHTGKGRLVSSGEFDGLDNEEAMEKITDFVKGNKVVNYKLRDWTVSRQRYWGVPIPIVHCQKCGAVPVPEDDLPVTLPEISDYLPREDGKSPLVKVRNWVEVKCPKCAARAERETDTLDTFVDSSWYYLRYTDSKNDKEFASRSKMAKWLPIDFYSGGSEHTTMHLLYSRFFHKALFDCNLVAEKEPYRRRMNRGLILGPDGQKMSKSRGNVIDPDEVVLRLGADTVRMYLAFIGPYNEVGHYPWDPNGVVGVRRFLERVWRLSETVSKDQEQKIESVEFETLLHKTIQQVSGDMETFKFNTAIARLMEFATAVGQQTKVNRNTFEIFLRLLAPFAPHTSEEIWHALGNDTFVTSASWPEFNLEKTKTAMVQVAIQVEGKVRGEIVLDRDLPEPEATKLVLATETAKRWIAGRRVKKVIYVKNRVMNIVV